MNVVKNGNNWLLIIMVFSKIYLDLNLLIVDLYCSTLELETGFLKTVSNIEIDNYKKETMSIDRI